MSRLLGIASLHTTYRTSIWNTEIHLASKYKLMFFFFQAEDGIRDWSVTGVQTCAFFFSSRRRHTRLVSDWSSDVCSSDLIAMLSMLGGFLTPLLVSTGRDEQIALFTYIFILCAGLLIMAWRRDWRWLAPVSFVLTQFYFWGWYDTFYQSTKLEPTLAFATLFLVIFSTLPVLNSIRSGSLDSLSGFLIALNAFNYLAAAYAILCPQHRCPLTLLVLAFSAAHLTVSGLLPANTQGEVPLSRLRFCGLALTFATFAIPIRLDGKWITLAFAVQGAILIWTGFRALHLRLRQAGYFLLALAAGRLLL